ncbi:transcriptional regulator, GntR family [Streptosporangium canum]|uniref:Transcriptional regulator, GntR family n=1 Tax=Streptosporangium canum TaxID=324952 RepID=A0A1I3VWT1_9ACTN|nr:PLP-dependent aminotransferase family protein [Streptosporangium canum]SFJ99630.1 transcriptional regulator, GntR family [Streptosporangium canum]
MSEFWATFGVDLYLELDTATGRRSGLEHALRDAVRAGRLAPGARMPSTRKLAAELGLSRGTVSAAYDQLIAEGYLTARRGSGTTVADLTRRPAPAPPPRRDAVAPRYDLRPGSPDVGTFPTEAWVRATRRALAATSAEAYDYGDPRGRIELRVALAEYLGRTRGVLATPGQIVITSGYVQGLALLARVLGDAGTAAIAMEDPGLGFHREVVRRAGPAVVALPVDGRGARPDLLRDHERVDAVVVTPAHQYPTGVTLHPARRRALTEWARAHDGLIVEDDYDGEFRYDRQPVGALQGMAPDRVAYLGSASKTLGPALRLGWMALPHRLVEPVVDAKLHLDHHTEAVGQLALADLITTHVYDRHIRACRLHYRRRRDLLLARLGSIPGLAVHGIAAGLHAMVTLPAGGPGEQETLAHASARGVALGSLGGHWHRPGDHPQAIIVGYGTPREHVYPAALDTLADVLTQAGAALRSGR